MKKWLAPVRRLVRRCGWDVIRYNWQTNINVRRHFLLRRLGIACVLDIGANVGDYVESLRRFGYRGEIVSVEPTGAPSKHWKHAVGAIRDGPPGVLRSRPRRASRRSSVASNSVSSSLMQRSAALAAAAPESRYIAEETVSATTLDALAAEARAALRPVWAKLDVQGSAAEILTASKQALRHLSALEIELPFVPMYTGEGLFPRMRRRAATTGVRTGLARTEHVRSGPGRCPRSEWHLRPARSLGARGMRILTLNSNLKGIGTYLRCYYFSRELARRGHAVTMATVSPSSRYRPGSITRRATFTKPSSAQAKARGFAWRKVPPWATDGFRDGVRGRWMSGWRTREIWTGGYDAVYGLRPAQRLVSVLLTGPLREFRFCSDWCDWHAGQSNRLPTGGESRTASTATSKSASGSSPRR